MDNDQARVKDGLPVEAHITAGLSHSNVVRTIAHAWRPLTSHVSSSLSVWDSAGSALGPATCSDGETWLLLELCDRGTLQVRRSHSISYFSGRFRHAYPEEPWTSDLWAFAAHDSIAGVHSTTACRMSFKEVQRPLPAKG